MDKLVYLSFLNESKTVIGNNSQFHFPMGIRFSPDYKFLYIADSQNHVIRKANMDTLKVETLYGTGVSGFKNDVGKKSQFNRPTRIYRDDLNWFVSDSGNHLIRKIHANNYVSTFLGQTGVAGTANSGGISTQLNNPAGAYYLSGVSIFADSENHGLRLFYTDANRTKLVAGLLGTSGFQDGFTNSGLTSSTARLHKPTDITYVHENLDPNDPINSKNIFFTDTENHCIRKMTNLWHVSTSGLQSSTNLKPDDPNFGSLPIDTYSGAKGTAVSGSTDGSLEAARFYRPTGIIADENHLQLFIADTGNHTIRMMDLKKNEVSTIAGLAGEAGQADGGASISRLNSPTSLEFFYPYLYISDSGNHVIRRLDIRNKELITIFGRKGETGLFD